MHPVHRNPRTGLLKTFWEPHWVLRSPFWGLVCVCVLGACVCVCVCVFRVPSSALHSPLQAKKFVTWSLLRGHSPVICRDTLELHADRDTVQIRFQQAIRNPPEDLHSCHSAIDLWDVVWGLSGTRLASQNRSDHSGRERAGNQSAAEIAGVFASPAAAKKASDSWRYPQ